MTVTRASITHQVTETLKQWIRDRELSPEDWIRQEEVARRLGVSRVPVREALTALAADGLVEIVPHRGVRVTRLTWRRFVEATVLRSIAESTCCRFVVERATHEGIAELEDVLEAMLALERESSTPGIDAQLVDEAFRLNWHFHMSLFRLSQFHQLSEHVERLWHGTAAYRHVFLGAERVISRDLQNEHMAMLSAIKGRDAEELVALHTQHRMRMFNHLRIHVFAEESQNDSCDWLLPALWSEVVWSGGRGVAQAFGSVGNADEHR
jgi:DNA-binding GntR family transcriptional regulator